MSSFTTYLPRLSVFLGIIFLLQAVTVPKTAAQQDKDLEVQSSHSLLISYQGRLTDPDGNPVADGNHTIVFSLYGQESEGTALWQETQNIETNNGVFSAQLGAVNSIDTLTFNRPFYLGIQVDGGDELTPRTRLTTVPYAQRAHSIDDGTITTSKLTEGAVASSNIERRAITSDKLNYAAVDSSAIDPDAVFKTLNPTLEFDLQQEFVGINRSNPVTGNDFFAVEAPIGNDIFGGMYVNTEGIEGWPFYGYAGGGDAHAWHLFDPGENEWILEFDFTSPRFRLRVTDGGVLPGGDDDLTLGNANHRWSEVHAANGTIQTSDRRLKTDIENLDYGLQDILKLKPVGYNWKKENGDAPDEVDRHLGLIAQDVQKVIGEVVEKPKDEGYLGMNYSELVPVLIQAIQEQQDQIRALQQKLQRREPEQTAKLENLNERINQLAREIRDKEQETNDRSTVSR